MVSPRLRRTSTLSNITTESEEMMASLYKGTSIIGYTEISKILADDMLLCTGTLLKREVSSVRQRSSTPSQNVVKQHRVFGRTLSTSTITRRLWEWKSACECYYDWSRIQTISLSSYENVFRKPGGVCSYVSHHYKSQCSQIYNYHRLLSWDKTRGLHMDIYKVKEFDDIVFLVK